MFIRYEKKDFLDYASSFDYYAENEAKFKKMKLNEFRDFYGFTHKDDQTGVERDFRNYKCLSCLDDLRPDFLHSKSNLYCANCE